MLGGITTANAWEHEPVMVDPFEFEPDFQWFEPVTNLDLADMKPKKRAHNGWFGTYDRLNLYASRSDVNNDIDNTKLETKLDSGWGHRYEVGYMLPDDDTGWAFTWTEYGVGVGEPVGPVLLRRFFGDIPIEDYKYPTGTTSINQADYDSFELNKSWRLEPYHYGGFLEPLMGIRFMQVDDTNRRETYIPPLITDPVTDLGDVTSDNAITKNDMFAGQLGFRYFKHRNRFTFSTDFRAFAGGSWQCSRSQRTIRNLVLTPFVDPITGATTNGIADFILDRSIPTLTRNEEGFVGFDLRSELAYQITRHFSVRGGVQLIDIATGVWRDGDGSLAGLNVGDRNQDFLMVGGTFGVSLNH